MTIQLKLYRWPEQHNGLIVIGVGQVEPAFGLEGLPESDEKLHHIVKNVFGIVPNNRTANSAFIDRVRKIILDTLKDGTPQLKQVALLSGLGPRTLERRLRKAGLDFTGLVDETRRRLAIDLLSDSQHKLTDIAFALGYSEVSAFNRAFKRWTNCTPLNFRRTQFMRSETG
jgi:AraC-like DNA-binding protein